MRMSQLFSQTLREVPAEAEIPSHQLLLRAGFIRQIAAGVFSYLPLARRSLNKIERIMRQEIEAIGGQEISMPVVQPAEIWKETGRWYEIDAELGRLEDRSGRDMVLAMTHEDVVAFLARREIRSYRQLPQLLFQIQTKWRDDPRPRAGLIRVREFTMKDSYSLDADWEGLERQYRAHYAAYFRIFGRCGLPVKAVKADVGMMGGKLAHEFMYLTPVGEDTLLLCSACGYSANRQIARFQKAQVPDEPLLEIEPVATPHSKTIEELAQFLAVPRQRTAKAVFVVATVKESAAPEASRAQAPVWVERLVFAIVRGDMEVNETKLANAVKARQLRPATEDEIRAAGATPGYASPVGLQPAQGALPVLVVVDEAIPDSHNLVAGANREGYHLRNVNYGRDYQADILADIASAQDGDGCPQCGAALRAVRGVEVGNIFQLETRYSQPIGATFIDASGELRPLIMGSYGIGSGRLLACVAEAYHDDAGLTWPVSVAPYQVHLVSLAGRERDSEVSEVAEKLYAALQASGVEVLFDDREESPGVKFNDADLIGLPLRLTVSQRALKSGGVEFKRRRESERSILPLESTPGFVNAELGAMLRAVEDAIQVPEYQD